MSYQVALLNFEGPLDLLLQLIERSELEITEISLSSVTQQYLSYINRLSDIDPLDLNRFVELAAKLIYIKSLALLPQQEGSEADEDLGGLAEQLEQYRHYQKASAYLLERMRSGERSWGREVKASLPTRQLPLPQISLETLNQVFQSAITRLPVTQESSLEHVVSLEEMMQRLYDYAKANNPASLGYLVARIENRTEALVLFLALLELIKSGSIGVSQDKQFDDIIIEVISTQGS